MAALPDAPEGWTFGWADLEFLIAPNTGWQWDLAQRLAAEWGEEYGDEFMAVPVVSAFT